MKFANYLGILGVLILPAFSGTGYAKLSLEQMSRLFIQGNEAFRQANSLKHDPNKADQLYQKAILIYERIINEGGVKNSKLYYNLGNAYFLKGNLGKAILNYRRAEKLDSSDPDIRKNLAFARSRRIDKVVPKTKKRVLQTLFFWHYDFSIRTKFLISCICFALICFSITAMIWLGRGPATTAVAAICGVLLVCFTVSVAIEAGRQSRTTYGVITARQVVAHQADWEDSPPSFKEPLHEGTEFELIERRPGWFHIRLADGSDGWLPENAAELL